MHAPHAAAVAGHATRALQAAAAYRTSVPPGGPVERAGHQACALWNQALFFEVHEVLEEVWKTAAGDTRDALQGVIQIAVAFHHLAHGNPRGARALLREGRERLRRVAPVTLPALDLAGLLSATAPWEAALATGTDLPGDGRPPVLGSGAPTPAARA